MAVEGFEVLHDSSKSFWKTRSNIEILICSHNKYLCIEIIAYNAETGIEAPRLYVSSALLATKLNMDDLQNNLVKKKESLIRQKKSFTHPEISKLVYNEMMVNFILTRLNISPGVDLKTDLKMVLTPMVSDEVTDGTNELDIICSMPSGLKPVITTYQKNLSSEEILLAQYRLKSEQINLMEATRLAELLASSSDAFKVMLEEQRRRSDALKAMSKYRLLWIKAIDRVLRQNFIEKVKSRLFKSSIADWFHTILEPDAFALAKIEAARESLLKEEAAAVTKSLKKQLRRSLDNSELPGLNSTANDKTSTSQGLPSQGLTKLPEINYHPRDVSKASVVGTAARVRRSGTRRTFDASEHKATTVMSHISHDPNAAPPSISQSFVDVVSKSLVPIMLSVVDDDDNLSVSTVKHRSERKASSGKTRRARM